MAYVTPKQSSDSQYVLLVLSGALTIFLLDLTRSNPVTCAADTPSKGNPSTVCKQRSSGLS